MNNEPKPEAPQNEISDTSNFDVRRANRERLAWKLGGNMPTERAMGYDESLKRDVARQIADAKDEVAGSGNSEGEEV